MSVCLLPYEIHRRCVDSAHLSVSQIAAAAFRTLRYQSTFEAGEDFLCISNNGMVNSSVQPSGCLSSMLITLPASYLTASCNPTITNDHPGPRSSCSSLSRLSMVTSVFSVSVRRNSTQTSQLKQLPKIPLP